MTLEDLIRLPRTIEQTGIEKGLLVDLILKHFYDGGVFDPGSLRISY
jgi:hypothetical protein